MRPWFHYLETALTVEGLPVENLRAGVRQTPEAQRLLRRFADMVEQDLEP